MARVRGRCTGCRYAENIKAQDNYIFVGCFKEPYKGKPVWEIERCPIDNLEKCPFCGHKDVFVASHGIIEDLEEGEGTEDFAVVCSLRMGGCGATGGYRQSEKRAIKVWNGRI